MVLNEARDKFLLTKKSNGAWDLPGGGLDWGETPGEGLRREIFEEMQEKVSYLATKPSYFLGGYVMTPDPETWYAMVVYEARLESHDFVPSDECVEWSFFLPNEWEGMKGVTPPVLEMVKQMRAEGRLG